MSLIVYIISFFLSRTGHFFFSGTLLILLGFGIGIYRFRLRKNILDPLLLLGFFWFFCLGISCLKLSYLSGEWTLTCWICFYLFYLLFFIGYSISNRLKIKKDTGEGNLKDYAPILLFINILMLLSTVSLIFEACTLGFIPLFTIDTPHAYSYFHLSGIHYLTVSFVLIPSLIVFMLSGFVRFSDLSPAQRTDIVLVLIASLIYPILMVSRFQLIFELFLALFSYLLVQGRKKFNKSSIFPLVLFFLILAFSYVFISVKRAHSASYLLGIFEMRLDMPVWIAQPVTYISNNFDNFNALTLSLSSYAHGLRELFPLFALSGLKFINPSLVDFPLFLTKEELTTITVIYDAYYDFGIIGVCLFSLIFGLAVGLIERKVREGSGNIALRLGYVQLLFYIVFSFFTTWFSNAATWYYFIVTFLLWIYLGIYAKIKK